MLVVAAPQAFADTEDNDVIIFDNGDRVTGEFKSMQRGKITIKSYGASTINPRWDRVDFITIEQVILVQTVTGVRHTGQIVKSDDAGKLTVDTVDGPVSVAYDQVSQMYPVESGGLKDVTVNISVGFNFAKANSVQQSNVGADVTQRTTTHITRGTFSSNLSDSSDNESSQRQYLGIGYSRLRPNHWLTSGIVTFDVNDELNIALRSSAGGGVGRILSESDHSFFSLEGGLLGTREKLQDNPEDTKSIESYIDARWDWYMFADPELDWSSRLKVIPSLTESGRVRGELDTTLSWKIIGDLKWQLEFYSSYDSKPQTEGAENVDFGINTSLAFKFN